MSDGVVIDANIIPPLSIQLRNDSGPIYELVTWLCNNVGLGINDFIDQEYTDLCSSQWFVDWYTDQIKNGNIRYIESKSLPNGCKKKMGNDYGFPIKNSKDLKYIICAFSTDKTKYIVTENFDFYDPKCYGQSIEARDRVKKKRRGPFCIFLKKKLGITVGTPEHCISDFCIS